MKQVQAKHKICRRIGYCIWNNPKCPSVKRPYAAGLQGKNAKKKKLSTYGEMMQEKQLPHTESPRSSWSFLRRQCQ